MLLELKENNMKKNKDWLVVKSNNLINAKGREKYTKNELKLIANLVANITPYDTNLQDKKVALRDLGFVMENTKNHNQYNEYFKELMAKPFTTPDGWVMNWFSRLKYENGYILYSFDEKLKPFLLELKANFTKYHLENIMNLSSSYSIHIYELLAQFRDRGGRSILLDDFRELLNIPKSYKNNDINKLISKVQIDLEENTNITFNYAMVKEGRSFKRIDFKIVSQRMPNPTLFSSVDDYEEQYKTYEEMDYEDYQERQARANVIVHENQQTIDEYLASLDDELGGNNE